MTTPMRLFDRSKHAYKSSQSSILPQRAASPHRSPPPAAPRLLNTLPKRYTRLAAVIILSICAVSVYHVFLFTQAKMNAMRKPPLYERYHRYEAELPQHNPELPAPEGKDAKFFWASNHVHGSGWGNAMQELLVLAHLAYVTKRSFVFDNFTWSYDDELYSEYNGKLIPARIPLTAMITGPIVGEPWTSAPDVPRAVSKNYFFERCPEEKRRYIHTDTVNDESIRYDNNIGAQEMFDRWVDYMSKVDDPCVEIEQDSAQLFSIWLFGSSRILDIWPTLSKSPAITQFGWSPLIRAAFNANIHLFQPKSTTTWPGLDWFFPNSLPTLPSSSSNSDLAAPSSPEPAILSPSLLVLHIRRGDFEHHCQHLANWSSDWNGFNKFPGLPDTFTPPTEGVGWGETSDANRDIYTQHCYPDVRQIVERVMDVKREWEALGGKVLGADGVLQKVYVMTNGATGWIKELKAGLMEAYPWDGVASSRDLKLNWEQKYVAQTVDMMIGQRAGVFIGNGL
ncbi:hypothetical protein HWV62_45727 [Athelia sp. TMB]|nr:hypothetical protein HWV62_45727 [Athelia sp. TMB]